MSTPFTNFQSSLGLAQRIAVQGVFPSREGDIPGGFTMATIRTFATSADIVGTAAATGSLLPISQNTALFSLLGTNFGGNGMSTYGLPDLSARTMIGAVDGVPSQDVGTTTGSGTVSLAVSQLPGSVGGGGQAFDNQGASLRVTYAVNVSGIVGAGGPDGLGVVMAFAGNFAPEGFLEADGRLLNTADYPDLFDLIGYRYGGSGASFALPDLRGRTIVGANGSDLGETGGTATVTLTDANLPSGSTPGQPFDNQQPYVKLNFLVATQGLFGSIDHLNPTVAEVYAYLGSAAPTGHLFAHGQELPINQNQALFSLLGDTFGGDGRATFALPDLRGRSVLGVGGEFGLGERLGSDTVALTQDNISNHVPDLIDAGPTAASVENVPARIDPDLKVSDADLDALDGGIGRYEGASFTVSREGGADALDAFGFDAAGAGFTVVGLQLRAAGQAFASFSSLGGTLSITFAAGATSALVDEVMGRITYANLADVPPASVTLSYRFDDGNGSGNQGLGGAGADTGSVEVAITSVNDAPDLTPDAPDPVAYEENAAPTPLLPTGSATDADAGGVFTGGSLRVAITAGAAAGDRLTLLSSSGFTVTGPSLLKEGVLVGTIAGLGTTEIEVAGFTGAVTEAVASSLLKAFGFSNTGEDPGAVSRQVTFTLRDGGRSGGPEASGTVVQTVQVTPINDVPTITLAAAGLTVDEDAGPLIVPDFATDITAGIGETQGLTLTAQTSNPSLFSAPPAITLFGRLTFTTAPEASGTATVTVTLTDDGGTPGQPGDDLSVQRQFTITVNPVNDQPVITAPATINVPEDSFGNIQGIAFSDPDANGAIVTVTLSVPTGTLFAQTSASDGVLLGGVNTSTLTMTGTIAAINARLSGYQGAIPLYRPPTNWDTDVDLTITINDGGASGGPAQQASRVVKLDLQPANDSPSISGGSKNFHAPAPVVDESAIPVRSVAQLLPLANFSDPDTGSGQGIVVIGVLGRFEYSTDGGAQWYAIPNNGTVNSPLFDGDTLIRYLPSGPTETGSLFFQGWDGTGYQPTRGAAISGANPNTSGGASPFSTATGSFTVNVANINDAPVLTPSGTLAFDPVVEDAPPPLDGGLPPGAFARQVRDLLGAATDPDGTTDLGIAVTAVNRGSLWYSAQGLAGTWTQAAGISEASALLLGRDTWIYFDAGGDVSGAVADAVTFRAWDRTAGTAGDRSDARANGGATAFSAASDTVSILVAGVNDLPVVTTSPGGALFVETFGSGSPLVFIDPGLTLSDPDDGVFGSATVAITGNFTSSEDRLAFANDLASMGNIAGTFDETSGALSLVSAGGTATRAEWEAALRAVRYENFSETPSTADRTVSISVADGVGMGPTATRVVTVTSTNDQPFIVRPAAVVATEDLPLAFSGARKISIFDPDAGQGLVRVALSVASGLLTLADLSGASVAAGANGTATLTLEGTVGQINGALGTLAYKGAADFTGRDTLVIASDDLGNSGGSPAGDTKSVVINVAPVNDKPAVTGTATGSFTEANGLPTQILADGRIIDPDLVDLDGTVLEAAVNGAFRSRDRLDIGAVGRVTTAAGAVGLDVLHDGIVVGTATIDPLWAAVSIEFNSLATRSALDDVVRAIIFSHQGDDPTSGGTQPLRGFQVRYRDADFALSDDLFGLISVEGVNDAPSGSDGILALLEDSPRALSLADFGFTDVDGDDLAGIRIASLPTASLLTLGGRSVSVGQTVAAAQIAAGQLVFAPAADAHGAPHARFTFQVQDNGGTASGGVDLDASPNTLTFDVTPVNDAPAAVADALSAIAEDSGSRTILASLLLANDSAGPANEAGQVLTITGVSSPVGGTVVLSGGNVVFTPSPDFNGQASFTYTVSDGAGGSASGTASFAVTPVNDAPLAGEDSGQATGGGPVVLSVLGNDQDGDPELTQSLSVTGASAGNGTVEVNGDGTLLYTPSIGFSGEDQITYQLSDGAGGIATGLVRVQVAFNTVANPPPASPPTVEDRIILGTPEDDRINAGNGNDQVRARAGDDTVFGEFGNDGISGEDGNDFIGAGAGDDVASGDEGNDEVYGELGDDYLFGNRGDDGVYGNEGNDQVRGGEGNDRVFGGTGDDGLYGEEDNDFLGGGAGTDLLSGGAGNDSLHGEEGDDELWGNAGDDLFNFFGSFGADRVKDFGDTAGDEDVIEFSTSQFASLEDLLASAQQVGAHVVITQGVNTLTLENIRLTQLGQDDFHFAQ